MTEFQSRWLIPFPVRKRTERNYLAWIERAGRVGDVRYLSDPLSDDLGSYGALLLPGGADVEPARYGAAAHPCTEAPNSEEDARELQLVHAFLAAGRPVFGICRGLQLINVALGGKLIQHVPDLVPESKEQHSKPGDGDAQHGLVWMRESRMADQLRRVDDTNSSHHQAIDPAAVGRGLRVVAHSTAGIVEAVEGFDGAAPVVAVQWHPERLPAEHPAARGLLEWFVRLAAGC